MLRLFQTILLLFLSFAIAEAQDPKRNAELLAAQPNGCGAGWSVYLVPDSIPLFACSFKTACDAHDNCYSVCMGRAKDLKAPQCEYLRCRPGGDLFNARECDENSKYTQQWVAAMKRRRTCDVSIGKDIVAGNPGKAVCRAFAYAYEQAVKTFGENWFQGLDNVAVNITQPAADYDAAIREFFRKGTDDEFKAFNETPPSFVHNLRYVPGRGLINVADGN